MTPVAARVAPFGQVLSGVATGPFYTRTLGAVHKTQHLNAIVGSVAPQTPKSAMLSTIEVAPSQVSRFFGYFAVLSLVMLPAAVAFARRKTSRWFLLSAGLLLLIGGTLNWWGLLPTFSWNYVIE